MFSNRQRMINPIWSAVPVSMHTPCQQEFRKQYAGRLIPSDGPVQANVHQITVHPDGTCDMVRLEAGANGWLDLGGQGARDIAAGRL